MCDDVEAEGDVTKEEDGHNNGGYDGDEDHGHGCGCNIISITKGADNDRDDLKC